MLTIGRNLVPGRYRGVSVATLPDGVGCDPASLRAHFLGRQAYRRTRFIVARAGNAVALLAVTRSSSTELFSEIVDLELLAGPGECTFVTAPEVDTAVPSELAAAAANAPEARAVVVQGRYAHVNFILEPAPVRVTVREVVPPHPAKLLDQARRVLAVTEDLPPIELVAESTDLAELAATAPAQHYLLPCRGSGGEIAGAEVSYLDEHPPAGNWTLLGCERSRQIHRWFYGTDAPTVDLCPKRAPVPPAGALLTKCCLQEEQLDGGPGWVSVPWGSSLPQVRQALGRLAAQQEPAWSPA